MLQTAVNTSNAKERDDRVKQAVGWKERAAAQPAFGSACSIVVCWYSK